MFFVGSYTWLLTLVYICFGVLLAVYFVAVAVSYRRQRRQRGAEAAVRGSEDIRRKHGIAYT